MESLLGKNKKYSFNENEKNLDLNKLTLRDLKLLEERQLKVLNNSRIVKNLPDGGDKIRLYLSKIKETIEVKFNFNQTIEAFSNLKVTENEIKQKPQEQRQRRSQSIQISDNTGSHINMI